VRERNGTKIFDDALMSADDAFFFWWNDSTDECFDDGCAGGTV